MFRRRSVLTLLIAIATAVFPDAAFAVQPGAPEPRDAAAWLAQLRSADGVHRMDIAYDLTPLAVAPERNVPIIAAAVSDTDPEVRAYVADALGELAAEAPVAVPALAAMLSDSDAAAGERAALALTKFRSDAVPALVSALAAREPILASRGPSVGEREAATCPAFDPAAARAVLALSRMGDDGATALGTFLQGDHPYVVDYAVDALVQMRSPHAEAVILAALADTDATTLPHLANAFGSTFPATDAVPALQSAMIFGSGDTARSFAAAGALATLDPSFFASPGYGPDAKLSAIRYGADESVLGRSGGASVALSQLLAQLADKHARLREVAVQLLAQRPSVDAATILALTKKLDDSDAAVRIAAISALGMLAPLSDSATRSVVVGRLAAGALHPAGLREWMLTFDALSAFRTSSPELVAPAMLPALEHSPYGFGAVQLQPAFGESVSFSPLDFVRGLPDDPSIVPFLQRVVRADPETAIQVVELLRERGPAGDAALRVLALSSDVTVRNAALVALPLAAAVAMPSAAPSAPADATGPAARARAIDELMYSADTASFHRAVVAGLADGDASVRRAALDAIAYRANDYADALAIVIRSDPDASLRFRAAIESISIRAVSPEAIAALSAGLSDPRVAQYVPVLDTAFSVLGARAVPMLRSALRAPENTLTQTVVLALGRLGPIARDAAPELSAELVRGHDTQARSAAASALILVRPKDAQLVVESEVAASLGDDRSVRFAAMEALPLAGGDPALVGSAYTAYSVETHVAPRLATFETDARAFVAQQTCTSLRLPHLPVAAVSDLLASPSLQLPTFPWPPPKYSSVVAVPREYLGGDHADLQGVSDRLIAALQTAGYPISENLFSIRGGFALVTPLEQTDGQWRPVASGNRWSPSLAPPKSPSEWFADLFDNPPGHFRMVVFAVTTDSFVVSDPKSNASDVLDYTHGASGLPPDLARQPFAGRNCFALVYQFDKKLGTTSEEFPGVPGAQMHLALAGIWPTLAAPK